MQDCSCVCSNLITVVSSDVDQQVFRYIISLMVMSFVLADLFLNSFSNEIQLGVSQFPSYYKYKALS